MTKILLFLSALVIAVFLTTRVGYAEKKESVVEGLEKRVVDLEARMKRLETMLSGKVLPLKQ